MTGEFVLVWNCDASKVVVVTLQSQEEAIFVDLRTQGGRWELDGRAHESHPGFASAQDVEPSHPSTTEAKPSARRKR